jgi:hypothetical protein
MLMTRLNEKGFCSLLTKTLLCSQPQHKQRTHTRQASMSRSIGIGRAGGGRLFVTVLVACILLSMINLFKFSSEGFTMIYSQEGKNVAKKSPTSPPPPVSYDIHEVPQFVSSGPQDVNPTRSSGIPKCMSC